MVLLDGVGALIGVDELLVIMSIYGNDVHVWYYLME